MTNDVENLILNTIFDDFLVLNVMIDKDKINKVINDILLKNGKVKKIK